MVSPFFRDSFELLPIVGWPGSGSLVASPRQLLDVEQLTRSFSLLPEMYRRLRHIRARQTLSSFSKIGLAGFFSLSMSQPFSFSPFREEDASESGLVFGNDTTSLPLPVCIASRSPLFFFPRKAR